MNTLTAWLVRALIAAHFLLLTVLDLHTVSLILRVEAFVLAAGFCIRYARTTWHETDEGRHLMAFSGLVAAFMAVASVNSLVGPYPWRGHVILTLYGLLAWLLWDRMLLLLQAQRQAREAARAAAVAALLDDGK